MIKFCNNVKTVIKRSDSTRLNHRHGFAFISKVFGNKCDLVLIVQRKSYERLSKLLQIHKRLNKKVSHMKNTIEEPDNEQGNFEKALARLNEKLKHFHCPICHAEDGITFYDDPFFVMHFDWDKTKEPWKINQNGYGKSCVMGVCNNCGYTMMFNVGFVAPSYKRIIFHEQRKIIETITEEIIEKKTMPKESK